MKNKKQNTFLTTMCSFISNFTRQFKGVIPKETLKRDCDG